jgi:translation initiation factor 5B
MAVWPCRLKTIACFCKRDPIILGVDILDGNLRVGTPLCVVKTDPATNAKEIIELGKMYDLNSSCSSSEIYQYNFTVLLWKSITKQWKYV